MCVIDMSMKFQLFTSDITKKAWGKIFHAKQDWHNSCFDDLIYELSIWGSQYDVNPSIINLLLCVCDFIIF